MYSPASPYDWDRAPVDAFRRFVVSSDFLATGKPRQLHAAPRLVSQPSAKVYISMFSRFMAWLQAVQENPRPSLRTLARHHLEAFLSIEDQDTGRPRLGSNIAFRYLRLLDRVLSHLGRRPNPARHLLEEMRMRLHGLEAQGRKGPSDQSMEALGAGDLERFLAAVAEEPSAASGKKRPYAPWKRERDRALLCMIAGAGLKPAEAIGMQVEEFNATPMLTDEHAGYFAITLKPAGKHPTSFGHTSYLAPAFAPPILTWLRLRPSLRIAGNLMFPSTRTGKMLSPATVYLLTKKTFERAGVAVIHAGGRTLRNTYAVSEIERATGKHALKGMLGLALEHSTRLYFDAAHRLRRSGKT